MDAAKEEFSRLLGIMRTLRSPEGCPWDREQTLDSLRKYIVEETYEVLEAIERRDWEGLAEELGDLQLQIVFQAEIAASEGLFDIARVLRGLNEKLIRRHPHVFDRETLGTAAEVKRRWEELKAQEKPRADSGRDRLERVPRNQPALLEAHRISKEAAKAGFDWQSFADLGAKLEEEFGEVGAARAEGNTDELEDEIGDLLFMAVNVARFVNIDPETALKRANAKFRRRFGQVAQGLADEGRSFGECSPDELDERWRRAKQA